MHIDLSYYGRWHQDCASDAFLTLRDVGCRVREQQEATGSLGGWSSVDCGGLIDWEQHLGWDLYAKRCPNSSVWQVLHHRDGKVFIFEVVPPEDVHVLSWLHTVARHIYCGSRYYPAALKLFRESYQGRYSSVVSLLHAGDAMGVHSFIGVCAELSAQYLSEAALLNKFGLLASNLESNWRLEILSDSVPEEFMVSACSTLMYAPWEHYMDSSRIFPEDQLCLQHLCWVYVFMLTSLPTGVVVKDQGQLYLSYLYQLLRRGEHAWANSLAGAHLRPATLK